MYKIRIVTIVLCLVSIVAFGAFASPAAQGKAARLPHRLYFSRSSVQPGRAVFQGFTLPRAIATGWPRRLVSSARQHTCLLRFAIPLLTTPPVIATGWLPC